MDEKPKKGLALLLGSKAPEDDSEGSSEDHGEMAKDFAEDMLAAVKTGSEEQLAKVIKNLITVCKDRE